QAVVADRALLPRQRRIVNDRGLLAAPAYDVAIDRVPAGVANRAGKPAAIHSGVRIEHLLGRLDPIDLFCRLRPKPLRIALPARVDVVITARLGIHGALSSTITAVADILKRRPGFASHGWLARRSCGKMLAFAPGVRFDRDQHRHRPILFLYSSSDRDRRPAVLPACRHRGDPARTVERR